MIIVLKPDALEEDIKHLMEIIEEKGFKPFKSEGELRTLIHVIGDVRDDSPTLFKSMRCVEKVMRVLKPYKLASREHHDQTTIVDVGDVKIGNGEFVVIAGPCSVENEEQIMATARILKKMGVRIMRASAFKPRTSPYDFQGLGLEGLKLLKKVRDEVGLLVETEVMDVRDVKVAAEYVDILRVGARNMQNFDLLKEMGKVKLPVILKRGMSATVKEFIMAAEYILSSGNPNVILCERGIRTYESAYRNTLDITAVALLKKETHLPVIVDPSHAAGDRELITPLSKASVAVGADGILIEMHPNPEIALSDGAQSLYPDQLENLLSELKIVCDALGKVLKDGT